MGRFHHHNQGDHAHDGHHDHDDHDHDHDHDDGHHHHEHRDREHHRATRDVGDHSGYATGTVRVEVLEEILGENDRTAAANRDDFGRHGLRVVNVMSSPGAGKTALLREVFRRAADSTRFGVVEGDIETAIDAERLAETGVTVSLVNTANGFGGECHLDATMVRSALPRLPLADLDVLIIENVGNLVCPAEFDVGEDARLMVFSVTEGEEKPLKYPVMFRSADAIVVNKIDLLPHLDFDLDLFLHHVESVQPGVPVLLTSARSGEGVDAVVEWITTR
jgi:hydrogenase nickel incorporation protein HypB